VLVLGSFATSLEHALEDLHSIQQIVCSETALAVLTTSGLLYKLALKSDSQVHNCPLQWIGNHTKTSLKLLQPHVN